MTGSIDFCPCSASGSSGNAERFPSQLICNTNPEENHDKIGIAKLTFSNFTVTCAMRYRASKRRGRGNKMTIKVYNAPKT
jgi:hypothetical protein